MVRRERGGAEGGVGEGSALDAVGVAAGVGGRMLCGRGQTPGKWGRGIRVGVVGSGWVQVFTVLQD